jgi:DNA-binding NarL/FixJ family response regulator
LHDANPENSTSERKKIMTEAPTLTMPRTTHRRPHHADSMPDRAAPSLATAPAQAPAQPALPSWNLTPQQWRVFLLVGRALSNKAIAHELNVAESTVKAHISAIFKVSGCRNRTEAALLSLRVRYGLLEPKAEAAEQKSALDNLRKPLKVRQRA